MRTYLAMLPALGKEGVLLLRIAVAFAFLYPPVSAWIEPLAWVGYFPSFLRTLPIEPILLLHLFGILEIIIGIWILSGWRILVPSLLAALILFAIVAFNLNQIDVLFRDIPIAFAALALALHERRSGKDNAHDDAHS